MKTYDVNLKMPFSIFIENIFKHSIIDDLNEINFLLKRANENKSSYFFNYGRNALSTLIRKITSPGDKIIMPAFISPSLVWAAISAKAEPHFVDIDLETFNMDPDLLSEKIESIEDVKAILVVHTFGVPNNMDIILKIVEDLDIHLIEDVAHSMFAKYDGKYVGSFGNSVLISMYKQVPNFHGALLISNVKLEEPDSKEIFSLKFLVDLANLILGPHQNLISLIRKHRSFRIHDELENKKPTDLSIKIFSHFLKTLEIFENKKRSNAELFEKLFLEDNRFIPQKACENTERVCFHFNIRFRPDLSYLRDSVSKTLKSRGIFCGIQWHDSPVVNNKIKRLLRLKETFPKTEYLSKSIINLPLSPEFNEQDISYIYRAVKYTTNSIIK